jgi:hypothetical protein
MIACYQDPELAMQILSDQLKYMELGIEKIAADPSILNIVVGRDLILRVLKRGMKDTKDELLADLDVVPGASFLVALALQFRDPGGHHWWFYQRLRTGAEG